MKKVSINTELLEEMIGRQGISLKRTAMMVAGAILQVLLSTGTGSVIAGIGIIAGAAVKEWGE